MRLQRLAHVFVCTAVVGTTAMVHPQSADGYWFTRTSMPDQRQELQPIEFGGKIFVFGGLGWSNVSARTDVYDAASGTWTMGSYMPAGRHHYAAAVVGDLIYIVGGYVTAGLPWQVTGEVLVYDPLTNDWSSVAAMNIPRGEHSAVVFDGKIYVFGGNDEATDDLNSVEVYDPDVDTWTLLSPMPTARNHCGAAAIDSLIYVAGGRQGYWEEPLTLTGVLEAYSPTSDTWYSLPSMPTPRSAICAAVLAGQFITMGGEIPNIYDEVESYDPAAVSWRSLTPMLGPRHGTAAAIVGDTIFVIAGADMMGGHPVGTNEGFVLGTCSDSDHDGFGDRGSPSNTCPADVCDSAYNPTQLDNDADGWGNECDNCAAIANATQADADRDGVGDVCDLCTDIDGDGFGDPGYTANTCTVDNCPGVANISQVDADHDGIGDACCCVGVRGNVNYSGIVDLSDLSALVSYLTGGGYILPCQNEANVNASGIVDLSDLSALVSYLTGGGYVLPNCV